MKRHTGGSSLVRRFEQAIAATWMGPTYDFHSYPSHAEQVRNDCHLLADIVESFGTLVDRNVLDCAAIGHDAGFGLRLAHFFVPDGRGGFRNPISKEELSAYLCGRLLADLGASETFILQVRIAILATSPDGHLSTVEAKILAAADLKRVGFGSFAEFRTNSKRLRFEAEKLGGVVIPASRFTRGSIGYLGLFSARRNRLTRHYLDRNNRSAWHVGATGHMASLARQTWGAKARIVLELESGALPVGCVGDAPVFDENTVCFITTHRWETRRQALRSIGRHYADLSVAPPMVAAFPTEESAISVRDHFADELYLPAGAVGRYIQAGFAPAELARVLVRNGTLHLYEKEIPGLEHPPFIETGDVDRVTEWLRSGGFAAEYETNERPFGREIVYAHR